MSEFVVDFRQANTLTDLAVMVGCPSGFLEEVVASPDLRTRYRKVLVPKKNKRRRGQYRTVWHADFVMSLIQKSLLRTLEQFFSDALSEFPHHAAHGYIRGRNIRTNAKPHAGQRHLLRADIKSFFDSISRLAIEARLESIGIKRQIAQALGALTTIDDALGQGLHTSPLLANLMCLELDVDLTSLANEYGCRYTRYADDVAISGPSSLPTKLDVSGALARFGFELSDEKYRVTKIGQAHFVTGLSVADKTPRVPRQFKRQLRQELYYAGKYGIAEHAERARYSTLDKCVNTIDGRICYLRSIEPALGGKLNAAWQEIIERDNVRPRYGHATYRQLTRDVYLFVDETWIESPSGPMLAVGMVLTEDADRINNSVLQLTEQIIADPYAAGRKGTLRKKGLHFADDAEDTRTAFVKRIAEFPIRGFLAFKRVSDKTEFKPHYLRLLRWLLIERLAKQFRNCAEITYRIAIGRFLRFGNTAMHAGCIRSGMDS